LQQDLERAAYEAQGIEDIKPVREVNAFRKSQKSNKPKCATKSRRGFCAHRDNDPGTAP
jgi:hypothetical protein